MNILGTHYFILLVATLGAWQAHDPGLHLFFLALNKSRSYVFKRGECSESQVLLEHKTLKMYINIKNELQRKNDTMNCYSNIIWRGSSFHVS